MAHSRRATSQVQRYQALMVPGAELVRQRSLPDLTTAWTVANGYSEALDWQLLNDERARNPSGIRGTQIDGYFPDNPPRAPYAANPHNGWDHDAQFVIRLPERWNGRLVVAPPPGNRRQYAGDFVIGDWALARGYAYASTDKGNWGPEFYLDGQQPGDPIVEWHRRVRELSIAARETARLHYGSLPERVYLFGLSNGGYIVRHALEHDAWLYDGGVDWSGTFWHRDGPNPLTFLPAALRWFPVYHASESTVEQRRHAREQILAAGFAAGSEPLWPLYNQVYWSLTQRIYRRVFDPDFVGDDVDYRYAERPAPVRQAVERVGLNGKLERPLITVHGSLDALLPPATSAEPYIALVAQQRRSHLHRCYLVAGGQHTDGYARQLGGAVRPMLPFARAAFVALERWAEQDQQPPNSGAIGLGADESAIAR